MPANAISTVVRDAVDTGAMRPSDGVGGLASTRLGRLR